MNLQARLKRLERVAKAVVPERRICPSCGREMGRAAGRDPLRGCTDVKLLHLWCAVSRWMHLAYEQNPDLRCSDCGEYTNQTWAAVAADPEICDFEAGRGCSSSLVRLITATQIDQWFIPTRRDAQELLPHLVRKLITATVATDHLRHVRIPAGDQIGKPGFDGTVSVTSESPYIPTGESVWEMGVSGDAKAKADDDYRKRTDNKDEADRGRTAFVFVTPRVWADKKNSGENWAKEKRDTGDWRAIRVLDATDLEAWLDNCPAVARWLARQMDVPLDGVIDVGGYVKEEFVARHGVDWSPILVIGGRHQSAQSVAEWLTGGSRVLKVRGESVEEAAFFVAACASRLEGQAAEAITNRCVFVSDPGALDLLNGLGTQHIVVALTNEVRRRARSLDAQVAVLRDREPRHKTSSSKESSENPARKPWLRWVFQMLGRDV